MEDADYSSDNSEKLSKINSAGLINLRLHNLWVDAGKHARKGRYADWNFDLDVIWRELGGDVDEGKEPEKKFLKFNSKLAEINPINNWKKNDGFSIVPKDKEEKKTKQYFLLMDKELFLRRLMNKQGKGTAYQDSIDDYMDG